MTLPVVLLPTHPAEGSVSMQRYWKALMDAAEKEPTILFSSPLGLPELPIQPVGRWRRMISKYGVYPWKVTSIKSSIVHILDHSSAHLIPCLRSDNRVVVTVHDLIPLQDSTGLTRAQAARFRRQMEYLKKADHLIAVSTATKQTLVKLLGVLPEKVSVCLNGSDFHSIEVNQSKPTSPSNQVTILSIGSVLARKNLRVLPAVFRLLKHRGFKVTLLRAGALLPQDLKAEILKEIGPANLLEHGKVSDETLMTLYAKADLLIFPSFLEGYGLPVVEAMNVGCPVVCSRLESLVEIAGNTVLFSEPGNAEGFAEAIERLMTQSNLRNTLIAMGKRRAAELSWEQHLHQCVQVYRSLASMNIHAI